MAQQPKTGTARTRSMSEFLAKARELAPIPAAPVRSPPNASRRFSRPGQRPQPEPEPAQAAEPDAAPEASADED